MVGRATELDTLVGLAADLRPGQAPVTLVAARAGMGKTRLVSEAVTRWRQEGLRVLAGGCAPVEGTPYAPLASALRGVLPESAHALQMLASERATSRAQLFESLSAAVGALSARHPLILVVEDLHWSDRATRDALTYLVRHSGAGRWGVVGTHRYEGPLSPRELDMFADGVARHRPVTRIALEPLTVVEVAAMAAGITGTRPADPDATSLYRRTGGIPLLVEEVLAAGDRGLPDHLRRTFVGRVADQGGEVAQALQVVAVADECDELVVAGALDVEPPAVAAALVRARDADLVAVNAVGYRFRHDLLRDAVYDDIPPGRRRHLHRRVAELLTTRGDTDPAVLAGHWQLAGAHEQFALTSLAAAEQAVQMHAPGSAHGHYQRVLTAWPRLGERTRQQCGPRDELLRRAALAAERSGDFARAVDLTSQRLTTGEPTTAAQALRWERLARYRWEAGDGHGSRAAYEEAVRVLPVDSPPAVRAKVLSGLAWHLAATFDYEEAKPLAAAALDACAGVHDQDVGWQTQLAHGIAWLGTTTGHEALAKSCRLATAVGAGDRITVSRMWLNFSNQRLGYAADREPNLRIALRAAAADGLGSSLEAALRYMLAEYLCETGRWDEAADEIDLNLQHLRPTGVPALFSWGYQARMAAWRGDSGAAEEALASTRSLTERVPQQPLPLMFALVGRAGWLLWHDRVDEAVNPAREAVQLGSVSAYDEAEPLAVLCRAEADLAARARRDGRRPDPRVHGELSGRMADLRAEPAPRARAFAATCAADRARWSGEQRPEPWRRAVEAWRRAEDPYQELYARWRLASALVADRSGRTEAATHLGWAAEVASRLGARPCGDALARTAIRWRLPLRGPRSAPAPKGCQAAALSAREREVLPLLAAGRSNAEIAEVLVISTRTVGTHVSHILPKLGATRRAQVAELARRAGLLED